MSIFATFAIRPGGGGPGADPGDRGGGHRRREAAQDAALPDGEPPVQRRDHPGQAVRPAAPRRRLPGGRPADHEPDQPVRRGRAAAGRAGVRGDALDGGLPGRAVDPGLDVRAAAARGDLAGLHPGARLAVRPVADRLADADGRGAVGARSTSGSSPSTTVLRLEQPVSLLQPSARSNPVEAAALDGRAAGGRTPLAFVLLAIVGCGRSSAARGRARAASAGCSTRGGGGGSCPARRSATTRCSGRSATSRGPAGSIKIVAGLVLAGRRRSSSATPRISSPRRRSSSSGSTATARPGRYGGTAELQRLPPRDDRLFYVAWGLGIASLAAAGVVAEREEDTWTSLIATPLSGEEILRAKMFGAVWGTRWLGVLLLAFWLLGLASGAVHPIGFVAVVSRPPCSSGSSPPWGRSSR